MYQVSARLGYVILSAGVLLLVWSDMQGTLVWFASLTFIDREPCCPCVLTQLAV